MSYHNIFAGLVLIAAGAFTSGSFATPFTGIKRWKWETYWLIFSFGAYIIFPLVACLIFAPGFPDVFKELPRPLLLKVFILGAVYGIGNLSFGLSLRYLGISLGYALSLGLMLAIGTLVPPLIDGRLTEMIDSSGGNILIAGVAVACVGIALTGWAGFLKDKIISETEKKKSITEFNLVKGIFAAVLVGITGSALSLAIEQGIPISEFAENSGIDPLFTTLPVMLLLLSGTFITTIFWCLWIGSRNRSYNDYIKSDNSTVLTLNYILAITAGLLWFSQFILYGMGKSKMGEYTFTSWGILMALTIAFATIWGLLRNEWKGAPVKIYLMMIISLLIIICASFMIGISGSL